MRARYGFTLLELSIVLVIIGLVLGGVMVGNELIRQAELRSITKEMQQWQTALGAYTLKYNALPGDHAKAFDYWGATCGTNDDTPTTGCNGNGDGVLTWSPDGEDGKFWEHLALSGIIPGNYPGTQNAITPGSNVPLSATGGGWRAYRSTGGPLENVWRLGTEATSGLQRGVTSPAELQSIDEKMDNGQALTGVIQGHNIIGQTCISGSVYNIATATKQCPVFVMMGRGR
jgi:prepilin-type N-terminal cleavage/methylation domain-containing protein